MTVSVVVVAAGSGTRLGATVPKAFVRVGDRTLVELSVELFHRHPLVDSIVVVVPDGHQHALAGQLSDAATVVVGGAERADSVRCGLACLPADCDVVLVHDAARPFVPPEVVTRVVQAVRDGADGVIPVLPVSDTVKRVDADGVVTETVPRHELRAVQTPQGFGRTVLDRAHATGDDATDDAGLIEAAGGRVVTVPGSEQSFKITTPFDLAVAEALFADRVVAP